MVVPGRGTIAVTILHSVLKSEIQKVTDPEVAESATEPMPEMRTWEDKSGKYKIRASFVRKDSTDVI